MEVGEAAIVERDVESSGAQIQLVFEIEHDALKGGMGRFHGAWDMVLTYYVPST